MDPIFLKDNLSNPEVLIPEIKKEHNSSFDNKIYKDFNPENHKVNNKTYRKDRNILIPDPSGATKEDGSAVMIPTVEKVNRIAIPLQQLITIRSTAFLTSGGVSFKSNPEGTAQEKALEIFKEIWRKNKCYYKNSEIGKAIYSETECAEIWYTRKLNENEFEIKCNIYKPSDGYDLIPVFDNNRDMIAFGLGYTTTRNKEKIENVDIYTIDRLYKYESTNGNWSLSSGEGMVNPIPLLYGKIPVIYYSAKKAIWTDVQPIIERLENLISNFGDTNDYNGSPILAASGEITGFSAKGETGKVVELKEGAELKYVSWDQAPESTKLEIEKLEDFIYTCTQTPNISFEQMKGLGAVSGVAFERIMIDAHLKAKDMQNGIYGEGIQRRCNFLINAISILYTECKGAGNLDVTPQFELFKIDDRVERVETLLKANGGKALMSHKESIAANGTTDDVEKTYQEIKAEITPVNQNP